MERVVFPIHDICSYLTPSTKNNVFINTERDAQGSKVTDFFDKWESMYEEMKWQRKLQDRPILNACTKRLRFWGRMAFFNAVLINIVLALCYPFESAASVQAFNMSNPFLYASLFAAVAHLVVSYEDSDSFGMSMASQAGLFAFLISITLFSMALTGIVPTLYFIGVVQVVNKLLHVSFLIVSKIYSDEANTTIITTTP
jgi:hypothetical protein